MESNHPSVLICPDDKVFKLTESLFDFEFFKSKGLHYDHEMKIFDSVPNNIITKNIKELR